MSSETGSNPTTTAEEPSLPAEHVKEMTEQRVMTTAAGVYSVGKRENIIKGLLIFNSTFALMKITLNLSLFLK